MRAASAPIRIPPRGRGGGGDDDATDDRESRGSDENARVRAASTSPLPKRLRTRLELSSSRCGRHVASAETTRRRLDAAEKKRTVRARVFFFPLRVVKRSRDCFFARTTNADDARAASRLAARPPARRRGRRASVSSTATRARRRVLARARRRPASLDPRASRRCLVTPHDSVSPRKFRQEQNRKDRTKSKPTTPRPSALPPARAPLSTGTRARAHARESARGHRARRRRRRRATRATTRARDGAWREDGRVLYTGPHTAAFAW